MFKKTVYIDTPKHTHTDTDMDIYTHMYMDTNSHFAHNPLMQPRGPLCSEFSYFINS